MKFANLDTIEAAKKAIGKLRSEKADITIIEDTCQQIGKHNNIETFIKKIGFNSIKNTLPIGDYALLTRRGRDILDIKKQAAERNKSYARYIGKDIKTNADRGHSTLQKIDLLGTYDVAVDTKQNLDEVLRKIGGLADEKIDQQAMRAFNTKTRLYILVAQDNINCMQDVENYCRQKNYNYTGFVRKIERLEKNYNLQFCVCPSEFLALITIALLAVEKDIFVESEQINEQALQTTEELQVENTLKMDIMLQILTSMNKKIEDLEQKVIELTIEKDTTEKEEFLS